METGGHSLFISNSTLTKQYPLIKQYSLTKQYPITKQYSNQTVSIYQTLSIYQTVLTKQYPLTKQYSLTKQYPIFVREDGRAGEGVAVHLGFGTLGTGPDLNFSFVVYDYSMGLHNAEEGMNERMKEWKKETKYILNLISY